MAGFVGAGLALLMNISLRDRSLSRYNQERMRAELSEMRVSYESNIARLNSQLTATEQRWKDVDPSTPGCPKEPTGTSWARARSADNFSARDGN